MNERKVEAVEELIGELQEANANSLEDQIETASEILADDDLVGFALVGCRRTDEEGFETNWSRGIDSEWVEEQDVNKERLVRGVHTLLCQTFEGEVRDWGDDK